MSKTSMLLCLHQKQNTCPHAPTTGLHSISRHTGHRQSSILGADASILGADACDIAPSTVGQRPNAAELKPPLRNHCRLLRLATDLLSATDLPPQRVTRTGASPWGRKKDSRSRRRVAPRSRRWRLTSTSSRMRPPRCDHAHVRRDLSKRQPPFPPSLQTSRGTRPEQPPDHVHRSPLNAAWRDAHDYRENAGAGEDLPSGAFAVSTRGIRPDP